MRLNLNFKSFSSNYHNKKNQIIFYESKCKNNFVIENILNNFLTEKNSFIFESVEKRKIKGRYTIVGFNPDKIWEFNKKKFFL